MSGPVVAICGPPGAGKSTLAATLAARWEGARVVDWDAWETFTHRPPEAIEAWLARGADPSEMSAPGLAEALAAAAARGPVAFETPVGRAHPETAPLIDLMVWIEAPADLALARKLSALLAIEGGPPRDWMAGWLAAYPRVVRPAAALQAARVRPLADLVIDAETAPPRQAEAVLSRLAPGPPGS